MSKNNRKFWKLDNTQPVGAGFSKRVYNSNSMRTLQIGKYRGADDMDEALNTRYDWHDKWYVDDFSTGKVKLFGSKRDALGFFGKEMRKRR